MQFFWLTTYSNNFLNCDPFFYSLNSKYIDKWYAKNGPHELRQIEVQISIEQQTKSNEEIFCFLRLISYYLGT